MSNERNSESRVSNDIQRNAQQSATSSNANNFRGGLASLVNPRTGKLQLSIHAPVLPGIGGLNVDLGLEYVQSDGVPPKPVLGLPPMWQYRLSYIADNQIVINGKQSFTIDSVWPSGMKYQSLLNLKLETHNSQPSLPYDSNLRYLYVLVFLNGERQYFDLFGRLIALADAAKNHVLFYYQDEGATVHQTRLQRVVDSYGQTISFDYPEGNIRVSFPSGGSERLQFTYLITNYTEVSGYRDPEGRMTTIVYGGGMVQSNLVSSIAYPNQLATKVSYTAIRCETPSGMRQRDVVSELTHSYRGETRTTRYSFDPLGDHHNYTGYPSYKTQTSEDQLLMSGDNRYRYETTIDNGVTLTRRKYNNLHLLLQTEVYASAVSSDLISRTVYSYPGELFPDQAFPSFARLPANYQMPCGVVSFHFNPGDTETCRAEKVEKTFNDAGQVTSETRSISADGSSFSNVQETVSSYDSRYGQMLTQDVSDYRSTGVLASTPAVTRLVRTLSNDGSLAASSEIGPVANGFKPSRITCYRYDTQGRVVHQTLAWADGGSHAQESTYHEVAYTYDANGHVLDVCHTDALGYVTHRRVDTTTGFVLSDTDARGEVTRYTYDGLGRRVTKVDPLSRTTSWSYDDGNNTTTVRHANGYEAYVYFDGFGKHLGHADNGGPGSARRSLYTRSYDEYGQLSSETGVLGENTRLSYGCDTRGRVTSITDALGNQKTFSYDAVKQTHSESYNGVLTAIRTFEDGRVIACELRSSGDEAAIVTSTGYDANGKAVRVQVGSDGSASGLVRRVTLDALARPVQVETCGGDGTRLLRQDERDLFGNIQYTTKTLDAGEVHSEKSSAIHTFDALGRAVSTEPAPGLKETCSYDGNGNLSGRTDLAGNPFEYAYDAGNALTSKSFTDAGVSKSLVYGYDSDSHRLSSIEARSEGTTQAQIRYTYELDGKLTGLDYGAEGPSMRWTYDQATGQLTASTDASGATTNYTYLPDGRLATLASAAGTASFSYYARSEDAVNSGKLKSVAFAEGVSVQYAYDGFGRIASVTGTSAGKTVACVAYAYDPVTGNLTEKTSSSALASEDGNLNYRVTYQYNGLGQLTQECMRTGNTTLVRRGFVYDAAGNLSSSTASGTGVQAGTTNFSYGPDNRLVEISAPGAASRTLRYDDNGNLVDDGAGHTLSWNTLAQLTGFSGGGASASYAYYPDGLRASKEVAQQSPVRFFYDHRRNANIVNELQDSTTVTHQFGGGRRLTRSVDGKVSALFHDRKNVVASLSGKTLASHRYGANGELDFPPGSGAGAFRIEDEPFAFAGEYRDAESGYYYFRSRYYDPESMRFVSRDSAGVFNRYSYCATNPVMLSDPSGHAPWWSYLTMGLAAVASVGISVASGGLLSWLAGSIMEGTSLAVTMAIDATAASAGAIASDAVTAVSHSITEHHWAASQFFNANLGIDVATSAAGSVLGDAVKFPVMEMGRSLAGESERAVTAARILAGAAGGVVNSTVAVTTNELAKTHHVDWQTVVGKGVGIGAVGGAVSEFGGEIKSFVKRQLTMKRSGSFDLSQENTGPGAFDVPDPKVADPELVAFRHLEFDEDIDAPVANAAGARAHAAAEPASEHNPLRVTGFLLRRRYVWTPSH